MIKFSKYSSNTFQVIAWSTTGAMLFYLTAVILTVFHVNLAQLNGALANSFQSIRWPIMKGVLPHLSIAGFWIPYWCAAILMFIYKERVRFMFWLTRFAVFGLSLGLTIVILNYLLRAIWPELCGRSENFLHAPPYESCQLLFITGSVVFGISLLTILCLRRRHWAVKLMMSLCSTVLLLSALLQGLFFPLQLIITVFISLIGAIIAYIKINLDSQERFPELYKI
jgi:hypothetical protein